MYDIWYDDNNKKTANAKILEGIAAYVRRFDRSPNVVLVNADEVIDAAIEGVTVRSESYVRKNNFYVGCEERTSATGAGL